MTRRRILSLVPRVCIVAALTLGLGATVVAADDGPRFSLQPVTADPASYFILDAQPGEIVRREVRVQNAGTAAGTVRLYPVDGTTGQTSGAVYRSEADPRRDVGAWIAIDAAALTLQPGESRVVPFMVTVPAAPRPGQHLGGLVAEDTLVKPNVAAGGATVNLKTVTITAVQITLPGPVEERVAVTNVTPGGAEGRQQLLLGLRNDGTVMLKPTGTLRVKDARGQEVQNLAFTMDTFVPQTAIDYPVALQNRALEAGDYEATVDLAYGSNRQTHATTRFTISPAQVAQVFATSEPPAATLAPPRSVQGPAQGNPSLATAPAGSAAIPTTGAKSGIAWLPIAGAAGGGMLLTLIAVGAFAAGRRRRL